MNNLLAGLQASNLAPKMGSRRPARQLVLSSSSIVRLSVVLCMILMALIEICEPDCRQ